MNVSGQLKNAQLEYITADPTPAIPGRMMYNTSDKQICMDDGVKIQKIGGSLNYAISSAVADFTSTLAGSGFEDITGLTVTLTPKNGRPIFIGLTPYSPSDTSWLKVDVPGDLFIPIPDLLGAIKILKDGAQISRIDYGIADTVGDKTYRGLYYSPSIISCIDTASVVGTPVVYKLQTIYESRYYTNLRNVKLIAYEL